MLQGDFFDALTSSYSLQKPFVAYRKPKERLVKCLCQQDSELYHIEDFTESGFVFAPFDSNKKSILFPLKFCEVKTVLFPDTNVEEDVFFRKRTNKIAENYNKHIALVEKGINEIANGQLKKVVLSRMETVPISEDNPISIFESLLVSYPEAFVYIWYHPKVGLWLGATPETLLKVEGQRFKTMSLAGTQPYKGASEVDWDQKNLEEQLWVTDFIETTLKPYVHNIQTHQLQTVRAGQLLHLKSEISGNFNPKALNQIIGYLHPTPAVCGMPKDIAKTFILQNESYDREYYTGFLGELNIKTSKSRNSNRRNVENSAYSSLKIKSDLYVNLRCMQLKAQQAFIYVGGGITKDSEPLDEWNETVHKLQTMLGVLR